MIGDEPTVDDIMDFRPATLRSIQYGVYVRDQFELNRRMTVSAGIRWEYYPLSQRADRGLEVFDFQSRQLLICGVSATMNVRHHRRKNLFTPRLGWAYRPTESTVIRVGIHATLRTTRRAVTRCRLPGVSGDDHPRRAGREQLCGYRSLNDGVTIVPQFDLTVGSVRPDAGMTTYRGKFERGTISSWNVSLQQLLP